MKLEKMQRSGLFPNIHDWTKSMRLTGMYYLKDAGIYKKLKERLAQQVVKFYFIKHFGHTLKYTFLRSIMTHMVTIKNKRDMNYIKQMRRERQ